MTESTANRAFDGRVALVTGASGGIGRAIALALADTGAALALSYGTSGEAADRLAAQITSRGDTLTEPLRVCTS